LKVPQEIEPIPIALLLKRHPKNNIYQNCVDISRKAEQIVSELSGELRERIEQLDMQEDVLRLGGTDQSVIEAIRQEVGSYRALPKPALLAIWEALYGEYPSQEGKE
jgi:hypothetical protein